MWKLKQNSLRYYNSYAIYHVIIKYLYIRVEEVHTVRKVIFDKIKVRRELESIKLCLDMHLINLKKM